MADERSQRRAPTRRDYVKYGGAVVGAGVLAGCAGTSDDSSAPEGNETSDATNGTAGSDDDAAAESTADAGYTVEMAPMGEVAFDAVPERWMAYFSTYGDMGIALGQLDGLQGLIFTENWPLGFFDHLPDVDVSFDGVAQLMGDGGIDKESFYELDADVHLMDPNFISLLDDTWTDADYEEVATNVGPIVGNSIRRRGEDWHDYRYYSLYEAFEVVADVFQERERYEALKSVHDGLIADIESRLPDQAERPTVGLLSVNSDFENGTFYAYPVNDGNGHKQYRDVEMRGAFDDAIEGGYAEWDYEQILEVDPDALLFQYGFSHVSAEEFERRMDAMREDPVGKQLTAVQNDRLYRGGTSYQGPLINLFQTEAAAKQFYPDAFGEWNGIETLSDPEARLFDYRRVADIVNGDY
ncbi:ABC transporter substrate-binding protein [Halorubrum salinarum]|uniref:ABC transporter substrate-binding protein n=1 Tax=Halorubrum salinarum TaxID=2739057 RepID=A0A7D4BVV0_9EURY|nr:ABC transporter substrate-binding protein [Halorubrum salinarum]QKG91955.1 ABC transporter substrate-binding protein [Halorubrum salinarum]